MISSRCNTFENSRFHEISGAKEENNIRRENQNGEVACNFNVVVRGHLLEKVIFKIFKQRLELENTQGGGEREIPFIMRKMVFTCVS